MEKIFQNGAKFTIIEQKKRKFFQKFKVQNPNLLLKSRLSLNTTVYSTNQDIERTLSINYVDNLGGGGSKIPEKVSTWVLINMYMYHVDMCLICTWSVKRGVKTRENKQTKKTEG